MNLSREQLEAENLELRIKYGKALELLAQYKHLAQSEAPQEASTFSKRHLLARYLEIQRSDRSPIRKASSCEVSPCKPSGWREKLVNMDKRLELRVDENYEQSSILELAGSLNRVMHN